MAGERQIQAGSAFLKFDIRKRDLIRGIGQIEGRLKRSASTINAMGQRVSSAGRGLQVLGRNALTTAAAAATPIALATARFSSLDDAIRAAGARMGATKKQVQELSAESRKLGRTTSSTSAAVAELAGVFGQAGFSPRQVLKMLKATQQLSRATGVELAEGAGVVAATLRQFNLEASEAGRVADVLTSAVNGSFLNLESLGEALSYVGAVANSSGASLEETVALVGQLGNQAIQGSSAGTALRRLFATVQAEGDKIKRIFGVDPTGLGLADAMDRIGKSIASLSREQQAAKLNEAFGLLGITSATILSQSADEVRKLENRLNNAQGAAAKTAEEIDAGIGGSFRRLTSAVEGFALAIGAAISKPVTDALDRMGDGINRLTDSLETSPGVIRQVTGGILALGAAGAGMVALGTAVAAIGSAFSVAALGITALSTSIGVALAGITAVISAGVVPALTAAAVGSAALAAGTAALLGLTSGYLRRTIGEINAFAQVFKQVGEEVGGIARTLAESLSGSLTRISEAFRQGALLASVKQFRKEATYQLDLMSEQIKLSMLGATYIISSAFSAMFRTIAKGVKELSQLLAKIDPTGTAQGVATAARVAEVMSGIIPASVQDLINKSQRRLGKLLTNPPSSAVAIQDTTWFADLKRGAIDVANFIVGAFVDGASKIGKATSDARKQAASTGRGPSGSIGSTANVFARNSANFGEVRSIDQEQLGTQEDMLAELQAINRNTAGKESASMTAADAGAAMAKAIKTAGGTLAGGLAPLGSGLAGSMSAFGGMFTPRKPVTGPSRAKMPRPRVTPPQPSAPPVGSTPAPRQRRPDTGTPFSGFGEVERHVRRFGVMIQAAADAVSWFPKEKPAIQPAMSDEPRWSNAIDQVGRGISSKLNGTILGARDRMLNFAGFRAAGGPVSPSGSYVVGERGPELFVPTSKGHVLSNELSKKVDGALAEGTVDRNKLIFGGAKLPDFAKPKVRVPTESRLRTQLTKKAAFEAHREERLARGRAAKAAREQAMADRAAEFRRVREARLARGRSIQDLRARIHSPAGIESAAGVARETMQASAVRIANLGGPRPATDATTASANMTAAVRGAREQLDPELKTEMQKQTGLLSQIASNTNASMM